MSITSPCKEQNDVPSSKHKFVRVGERVAYCDYSKNINIEDKFLNDVYTHLGMVVTYRNVNIRRLLLGCGDTLNIRSTSTLHSVRCGGKQSVEEDKISIFTDKFIIYVKIDR